MNSATTCKVSFLFIVIVCVILYKHVMISSHIDNAKWQVSYTSNLDFFIVLGWNKSKIIAINTKKVLLYIFLGLVK